MTVYGGAPLLALELTDFRAMEFLSAGTPENAPQVGDRIQKRQELTHARLNQGNFAEILFGAHQDATKTGRSRNTERGNSLAAEGLQALTLIVAVARRSHFG